MFNRDLLAKDIESLVKKFGSRRAVAKATGVNCTSLENYLHKNTEPREANVKK